MMEPVDITSVKQAFSGDGYVFLPGFLSPEEVKNLNSKLQHFIAKKIDGMPAEHIMYEDKTDPSTLKQLQDLNLYDNFFNDVLLNSKFAGIAASLLEENVIGKTLEYFNKPPKIGKPTPPHQDGYYFMLKPASAVTMWIALEEADEENGCVRYVKASHLKGMRNHGKTSTMGFSQAITDYGRAEDVETIFPAKPGDLLIHHALTIHRAGGNQSGRTRKAMGLIYFGVSAQEDIVAKTAYQAKLAAELKLTANNTNGKC